MVESENPISNEESCKVILDTAKTIYNEESERFKQAENKTNIAIAFVGILFGSYLTYLGSFTPITNEISYLLYSYSFKLIIFVLISLSIRELLKAIRTGEYDQVSLDEIVTTEFGREDPAIANLRVAATYKDAIDLNKNLLETKMNIYSKGLKYVFWGFSLFAIHFLIEEVVKVVGG